MRLFALLLASVVCAVAQAAPVVIVTAQDHATIIARRGALIHSGCSQTEGIGTGNTPEQARRNCCFFGKRQIVEEGVSYSPITRRWYAVIRYR